MSSPYKKPTVAPLRKGLFKDGSWCCECAGRPLAAHRQVKKETPNKGKWFWTCAKSSNQCGFFLWETDATMREQTAVLANSRSEPDPLTLTPSKSRTVEKSNNGLLTPQTERRFYDTPPRSFMSPPKTAKARMISEASDEFDWNESDDNDELVKAISSSQATESFISQPKFYPESPSKTPRTSTVTSPGKRKLFERPNDISPPRRSMIATPFSPASSCTERFPSSAEVCMTPTPSRYNNVLSADSAFDTSDLATSLLGLLEKQEVVLPNKARDEVVSLLNRQDLKMKGIVRGRDMTRLALKKKDDEISKLRERVANLEAQRELDRTLTDAMKPSG